MTSEREKNGFDKTQSFNVITHGMTVSHYKIEKKIGAGGMGEVFLARDTRLNRNVALKFLPQDYTSDPEVKSRFMREAQAGAALNHPNIITVYEVAEHQNRSYIAMEYVDGESLKDLAERKDLRLSEIMGIGMQIGAGLAKAHEAGIVHRDIKPQNVLIGKDDRARIVDFGLAKLKGDLKITRAGSTLGTVSYMSPEQAQGEEVDRRSDVFSLGVMLYEMITGRLPFQGEHQAAILNSIVNQQPQPLARYNSKVSPELERIVSKTLSKDKAERYQHADDLLADLRREQRTSEQLGSSELLVAGVAPKPKKRLLSYLVPASVVFVLLLALLILKPFRLEVAPEGKAVAEESSLAVMYFDNLVDPEDTERIGQMITSLLITDLSESQYVMRVVSRQRLYDILKLLGKEDLKRVDRTVASEVAHKAGVSWILTGNILQTEPNIVLTSDISDAATGEVLVTQRVSGEEGEDLFAVVDKLSAQIKEDLALPGGTKTAVDRAVADVTTHSPEAYRCFLDGLDNYNKVYFAEATRDFEKALEYDSTFAMAYSWLARLKMGEEQKRLVAKAVQYSDKVTKIEKYCIKIQAAGVNQDYENYEEGLKEMTEAFPEHKETFLWLGNFYYERQEYDTAISYYNKAIKIDPLFKLTYNMLAYTYDMVGDFEKSIEAINRYISIAPEEANPYDTRGDLYAWNGKIDQAIESYRKALDRKPDFYASQAKTGHMYLFRREFAKAESCYKELSSSDDEDRRSEGRTYLALVSAYQGKFEQALRILDDGLAADRMEQAEGNWNARKHYLKALILIEQKRPELASQEAEKAVEIWRKTYPDNRIWGRQYHVQVLAEGENIEKAEQVAQALRDDIKDDEQNRMRAYAYALGWIDFVKGNAEESIANLEKAGEGGRDFIANFMLARAYLESGRLDRSVAVLEKMLSRYDEIRAWLPVWAAKAHYLLGLAYEKSDWNSKAAEKYEEFLDLWEDADSGIPEVEDAEQRLARLKSKA
ncbi:MAG: protein kinase [Candidatus Zixiibacteriota bacterium]